MIRQVALVDDDEELRASIAQMLRLDGVEVLPFSSGEAALEAIGRDFVGVVVTDVRMPGMSGIELFRHLRERDAGLPVLLLTGHGEVAMAVDALKSGAWDFLTKPFDPDVLQAAIGRAHQQRALVLDNRRLQALADSAGESPLVGRSAAITQLRETISVLANADIDVLIEGETGTGKELVARLIHAGGRRNRGRFVTIACAAVPDALLDAELFSGVGGVTAAHNGTLFLDDVDQASPALKARLVQLAEQRAIVPAGRREPVPVNCRIIATAAEDEGMAPERIGTALYYRLAAVRLRAPPLRERLEDVPLLFAHLLGESARRLRRPLPDLTAAARRRLAEGTWPGNVRELAHLADRLILGLQDDPPEPVAAPLTERVAAFERQAIVDAVVKTKGDIGAAIAALGLPRKTFYYKVHRHAIDLPALRRARVP